MSDQGGGPTEKDFRDLFTKGKDFLDMYSKVTQFTKELVEENERLQARINELIQKRENSLYEGARDPAESRMIRKIEELRREKQDILNQYRHVEEENQDFMDRYREIETENNNLANLYVASYQLHSTLDIREVLEIITEIILNLIGAQTFAILLLNDKKGELECTKAEGMPEDAIPRVHLNEGVIGKTCATGEIYYREAVDERMPLDPLHPMVAVPLQIKEEVIGVIAVYQLFAQKKGLSRIDYDLFALLAGHAATAIFSAKLYGDSVRKQATIKGFLDLLTH